MFSFNIVPYIFSNISSPQKIISNNYSTVYIGYVVVSKKKLFGQYTKPETKTNNHRIGRIK